MTGTQAVAKTRRTYNQYVADETREDYALRFTALRARLSSNTVGQTALGATAFLACEAIGGSLTLTIGTTNALIAIAALMVLAFVVGLPIAVTAAREGLDIDLLTRAAGFGYLGSTVTSLIYATFTFVLFSIEASIMSVALEMTLGLPLWLAHLISALIVIPVAAFGIRRISRLQRWTQPVWIVLQVAPLVVLATMPASTEGWLGWDAGAGVDPLLIGAGLSLLMSLLPQIGEQVDYLRFMPARRSPGWWSWLMLAGPGWVLIAGGKLVLGSVLAWMAMSVGASIEAASQPAEMFRMVFTQLTGNPTVGLILMGVLVCVAQVKINVTNAYAGSIAWSNTFSRVTHTHPGRVVWLVFNVLLALLLMEFGIFRALESILDIFAILACAWLGAVAGDLAIAKPLGLSPRVMEFKRAHLYDLNPVGCGAMILSILVATTCLTGLAGPVAQAFCVPIGLGVAVFAAPLIAWATGGRYYIARTSKVETNAAGLCTCGVCGNDYDARDVAQCPFYAVPICSLCCSLEGRCHDTCKPGARASQQAAALADHWLPPHIAARTRSRIAQVGGLTAIFGLTFAALLAAVARQIGPSLSTEQATAVNTALGAVFVALLIFSGLVAWFLVLQAEARRGVEMEFEDQAQTLMQEVTRRIASDEAAQAANFAKSRFLTGLSHELRSPLNSIFGYAQLMERAPDVADTAVPVIKRSAEHLTDLIDGLQDISRVESGTLVLSRDRVILPDLMDQLAEMFRHQARAKGLTFAYHRADTLPRYVRVDRKRLRQVLINLLTNAVKFTPKGEVGFRVSYSGTMLQVEITDSGIGIAADDLDRIYQPFDRGSSAEAQAIPGTGLGLTITKLLVEIMGGTLDLQSQEGKGTQATVRLMMFGETGPDPRDDVPVAGFQGRPRRVLVVDDTLAHAELARDLLEPLGFDVALAVSGDEALAQVDKEVPDLALLDVSMPGMNGWELARRLRAGHPGVGILMVSANATEAAEAGDHDGFVAKPYEAGTLFAEVGRILKLDWRRETTDPQPPALLPPTDALRQAASIGHMRGVKDALAAMEAAGADAEALARWQEMAARFDLPAILADLDERVAS